MAFSPLKHSQIEPLAITFGEETFTLYYKPFALTYGEFAQFTENITDEQLSMSQRLEKIVDFLLRVVERADWVDAAGNPLPFNREVVGTLPFQILNVISGAVITALSGGSDKSKSLAA